MITSNIRDYKVQLFVLSDLLGQEVISCLNKFLQPYITTLETAIIPVVKWNSILNYIEPNYRKSVLNTSVLYIVLYWADLNFKFLSHHMNWSFLQAECMDELSIVLAPAVSAEPEAALFDSSRFLPAGEAKGFQLIEAKALKDGVVCSDISQTKQPAVEHDSFEQ